MLPDPSLSAPPQTVSGGRPNCTEPCLISSRLGWSPLCLSFSARLGDCRAALPQERLPHTKGSPKGKAPPRGQRDPSVRELSVGRGRGIIDLVCVSVREPVASECLPRRHTAWLASLVLGPAFWKHRRKVASQWPTRRGPNSRAKQDTVCGEQSAKSAPLLLGRSLSRGPNFAPLSSVSRLPRARNP